MFGANLRQLARAYPSISELSRQLGINRTQFNRYLAGESFPRPDVLARICDFFNIDARVLLEPVSALASPARSLDGPELAAYVGAGIKLGEDAFPSGFYRFSRRSFMAPDKFLVGLIRVWRNNDDTCLIRGFEAREAIQQQGLSASASMREFRGICLRMESGVGILASRRQTTSASFNFLHPVVSFENNFWTGYVGRTVPEATDSDRVARMVYEHLGGDFGKALQAGRNAGLIGEADMPSYHLRLLKGQETFR